MSAGWSPLIQQGPAKPFPLLCRHHNRHGLLHDGEDGFHSLGCSITDVSVPDGLVELVVPAVSLGSKGCALKPLQKRRRVGPIDQSTVARWQVPRSHD